MALDQNKFSFISAIRKVIKPTNLSEEKKYDPENVLRPIALKSVCPKNVANTEIEFKGISTQNDLSICFAENFTHSGGKFIYTENERQLISYLESLKIELNWNHIYATDPKWERFFKLEKFQEEDTVQTMQDSDAAISWCQNLSAQEGVIILSPQEATTRKLATFPKNHIIVAYKNQLKENINEAIVEFRKTFNNLLPSVLELYEGRPVLKSKHKELLSAEGPKNVYLFYIDKNFEY